MSYRLTYNFSVDWVGGVGPMQVPASQVLSFQGLQVVPGGDTATNSNFSTAASGAGADMNTQIIAAIARITAFNSGNP